MANPRLTDEQAFRVAAACILDGVPQSVAAQMIGTNQGRIGEAVGAYRWVMQNRETAYLLSQGKAKVVQS